MTFSISRTRRNLRVRDRLTPEITNLIREKLANQSMASIARELDLPPHVVKRARDDMINPPKPFKWRETTRRDAELFVLSRVGKCTDEFAEFEKYVHEELLPAVTCDYDRNMKQSLARVSVYVPKEERN